MLPILILLFSFPSALVSQPVKFNFRKLILPNGSAGPESITFDPFGRGPYTGISDGRIVRYNYHTHRFDDFAFTTPNRSKAVCDGTDVPTLGPVCGRPLGIEYHLVKNQLFIADAYRGLLMVGPSGGLARLLAASADGVPFKFLNGLSVDQSNGDVYFTDFSSIFPQSQFAQAVAANDTTGRLLKYDHRTQQVKVLLKGLSGANGVAISSDRSYVLVAETIGKRILKFRLTGRRSFSSEVVATFDGGVDNIRRTLSGDFWVVIFDTANRVASRAVKIDGNGRALQNVSVGPYYNTTSISEFNQRGFSFIVGSVQANYVGVLKYV